MSIQQCTKKGCTNGVAYLCHEHSSEAEQNHALQTTNTKLTLENRELTKKGENLCCVLGNYMMQVAELEQDGKRLDLIEKHLLVIHTPAPSGDEFDGLWVVCAYELPNKVDCLSKGGSLRYVLDKVMGEEKEDS